jgi:transposase
MSGRRRRFTREFKIGLLQEIESGKSLAEVCRENDLHPSLVSKWKKEYEAYPEKAFSGNGKLFKDEAHIAELERKVGQLYMEKEFLKKVLEAYLQRSGEEKKRRKKAGGSE